MEILLWNSILNSEQAMDLLVLQWYDNIFYLIFKVADKNSDLVGTYSYRHLKESIVILQ